MNAAVDPNKFGIEQNNFVDILLEGYEAQKENLIALHNAFDSTTSFNKDLVANFNVRLPALEKSLHLLNVSYWGQIYQRSNIAMFLDTEKRSKWASDLHVYAENKAELPEFTKCNILSTLSNWYESRTTFFIDRVDLVFQKLSRSHVTNEPQGFSRKMIFTSACDTIFSTNEYMRLTTYMDDILYDLAGVIAVILNIPIPPHQFKNAFDAIDLGKKHAFFGNTFEVQVFKNGNLHVWVHPEIAIDLNLWLAKKYPSAIATENRTKPKKIKEFDYSHDYLTEDDFQLLSTLSRGSSTLGFTVNSVGTTEQSRKKAVERFAKFTGMSTEEVLNIPNRHNFGSVANAILRNGYPNVKDHQFYATPKEVADSITEHLTATYSEEELSEKTMLEPSAGTGNLALLHPCYPTHSHCVEVSEIFSKVLTAKGLWTVENIDFMKFKTDIAYDLVVMNPPYKQKQLENHLEKALTHLKDGGELIAVVPKGKVNSIATLSGFEGLTVISTHGSAFEDTSIETAVISIQK